MRKVATRLALVLIAVSAIAWPPSRRWLADVLAVTSHHLDHGPDAEPPPEAIERGQRAFARHVADALVKRAANEHHNPNGHSPNPI